ncbi:hypothetical protein Tco_0412536 [Tanacetum coccineum]
MTKEPMFNDSNCDDLNDLVDEGMENQGKIGADDTKAVNTAVKGVSIAAPRTPPTTTTVFDDEDVTVAMAMAQTLIKIKEEKGVAIKDVEDFSRPIRSITTLQPILTIDPKDKGKGVLVKEEPEKSEKVKRRDQGAQKEKQKQEEATNDALAKEFDEIQARMDADHELAVRLTHEEQENYTIKERATLLAKYFERRKKQLTAERAEAIRNKPPIRAQVRNKMITYLKYIEDSSNTKKVDKRIKRIADSTSKKKSPKKSKVIKEQESAENKDETVDLDLLSVKYPIVDYESQNLGSVDMEDIHTRLNGFAHIGDEKVENNTPEGYNLLLWGEHKVTFEPNAEDEFWSNQQDWILISWKLYENCRVHLLLMDGTLTCFNMLVEKIYPLIKEMLEKMLNWKLEAEADSTMAFELLKFINAADEDSLKQSKLLVLLVILVSTASTLDDLVMQWNLVKERFSSTEPTDDKERTLWVELKRLFEPNTDDTL